MRLSPEGQWRPWALALAIAGVLWTSGCHAFDEALALRESQAAIGRELADYAFTDANGQPVRLSELHGKPLLVSFVYTGCFQVCPASTQFLADSVRGAQRTLGPGRFRVASIGFNLPFDSPTAMKAFATRFGIDSPDWLFLSPRAEDVAALAADFGFRYEATAAGFDHLLQVSVVDAQGRLYRQVYGDEPAAPQLVGPLLALATSAPLEQPTLSAIVDKLRLVCTIYDPSAGRYRLNYVVIIELATGASVLLAVAAFLGVEWRRRRRTGA